MFYQRKKGGKKREIRRTRLRIRKGIQTPTPFSHSLSDSCVVNLANSTANLRRRPASKLKVFSVAPVQDGAT